MASVRRRPYVNRPSTVTAERGAVARTVVMTVVEASVVVLMAAGAMEAA